MITEEEYLADIYKIGGLALLTPLCKLFFEMPNIKLSSFTFMGVLYFLLCIGVGFLGLIFIEKGYTFISHLYRRRKKWTQE